MAQHVSGVIRPIIRSIQLHPQPLVFHTLQVEGCSVVVRGQGEARVYYFTFMMMGIMTPETCWATNKRQVINLEDCCVLLVDFILKEI